MSIPLQCCDSWCILTVLSPAGFTAPASVSCSRDHDKQPDPTHSTQHPLHGASILRHILFTYPWYVSSYVFSLRILDTFKIKTVVFKSVFNFLSPSSYSHDLSKGLNKWESPLINKTADFVDVSTHAIVIDERTLYTLHNPATYIFKIGRYNQVT